MDGLYSIGETAKLNDVSIKSLRHYDEIGLLKPMYIDPETGYRYYAYSQFSFIDKIKRYKNVGLSLKDLKEVFQNRNLGQLEELLREQQQSLEEEARRLERKRLPQVDYAQIKGLRLEAVEKLNKVRPENIGQAGRISGVSPADISVLLIWLAAQERQQREGADQ